MLDKTADAAFNLATWLFDKTGQAFIWLISRNSNKDRSNLHKYRKAFGFLIVGVIVTIIILIKKYL
ncbi:MAG: hypothetical protein PHX84_02045 [Candidatus Shapirobacteria bacterium]|jgi:hypothetical protein|nr:hypothetical protein [Candidatus Shapirobacteria bacterium]